MLSHLNIFEWMAQLIDKLLIVWVDCIWHASNGLTLAPTFFLLPLVITFWVEKRSTPISRMEVASWEKIQVEFGLMHIPSLMVMLLGIPLNSCMDID
jgi:hypothetical protein